MGGLVGLFNFIPYKREISAIAAFIVVMIQAYNSLITEFGHGVCIVNPADVVDALNAAGTCAADWTLKIPETVNAAIMALLGIGAAAGKTNDKADILAQIKPTAQLPETKK
jgi:hypothetical protein